MWTVKNKNIRMIEGDYGIVIAFRGKGISFSAADTVKFTFKSAVNGTSILTKQVTGLSGNIVELYFTSSETSSLPVGQYVYSMDWYRNNAFMCNLIPSGILTVEEKA